MPPPSERSRSGPGFSGLADLWVRPRGCILNRDRNKGTSPRVPSASTRSLGRCPMSANGLDVFDKTLQTTHTWLDELMAEIGPDRQVAWHVLGVVLRAVRDRIPLELAVHLGSQLPLLVRGTYYDQWHAPGRMAEKPRSLDEFLAPIGERLAQIR